MNYVDMIVKAIDYIEDNLIYDLSLETCSRVAGYSDYHFHKIFKATVGMTLGDYIKKRRLTLASNFLLETEMSIFDIAIKCGFNSSENFSRSFKKEHGIRPSEHRKLRNSLLLFNPYVRQDKIQRIEPQVVVLDSIEITCYKFETSMEKRLSDIPRFWNKYHALKEEETMYDYGWLQVISEEACVYWIGSASDRGEHKLVIPSGKYLKFDTPKADAYTFVESIHKTWTYIYEYLQQSKYRQSGPFAFERYIESSRIFSEEIYIPIEEDKND